MFEKIIQNFRRLISYNPKKMSKPRTKECDSISDELLRNAVIENQNEHSDHATE